MVIEIACKICHNTTNNKTYSAREMMFGYRDTFTYIECSACGCVQIQDVPSNLSKYYPPEYYSFDGGEKASGVKLFLKRQLVQYCLHGKNAIGWLLSKKFGRPFQREWFQKGNITKESNILDVGCGAGQLLNELSLANFSHLTGVDPFIEKDLVYENGVQVFKKEITQMNGQYDFIMLHHSFEHVDHPLLVLKELHRLLRHDRYLLIRIPVASFAWKKYGINWVQLDPPRHLFLHTAKSLELLAKEAGFTLTDTVYDSSESQFWGSEQYIKDIPLKDTRSYGVNPKQSIFTEKEILDFRAKAVALNKKNEGDMACFYLYKP